MVDRTDAPAPAHEAQTLRELHALLSSDGHAASFRRLGAYRSALIGVISQCYSQAAIEIVALIRSDAYAITFQTLAGYRDALLATIAPHITQENQS